MASSETDCPLTNLVFDLRKYDKKTRKRLTSAADFVLRHAFDNPHENPIDTMQYPDVYMSCGNDNFARFIAAKLVTLNMLHLEDAITKNCTNVDLRQISDEDLNSMIEEVLKLKEQKNKEDKEPTYPKGTGISCYIIWGVMETKLFEPKYDNSSSDLCHICMGQLMNRMVYTLPYCQHEFHIPCFERRICENTLCPICQNWALPLQVEYPNWIKDLRKVRDFLTRDRCASFLGERRYITSVSAFHALMAAHLEELGLRDVLKNFHRQIFTIMDDEKKTRIDEHDMIRKEVVEFLEDCRYIKEGLVERFHSFMKFMFIALRLDYLEQKEFGKMMKEVNVHQLKNRDSIRKLSRFVQPVEYVQGGLRKDRDGV